MRKVSLSVNKLIPTMGLCTFTVFLAKIVRTHAIYMLVSPMIAKIIDISLVFFSIICLISFASCLSFRERKHKPHVQHEGCKHDEHEHQHMSVSSKWGKTTTGLIIATSIVAFSWHPRPLGAETLTTVKTMAPSGTTTANTPQPTSTGISESEIAQDYAAQGAAMQKAGQITEETIAYDPNPSQYLGHRVSLEGFVYHVPGLPTNQFILTRYFIFCCIADASPIGILVDDPSGTYYPDNQWVIVNGTLVNKDVHVALDNFEPTSWYPNTSSQPVLEANKITKIPVPELPYIVPTY